MNAPEQAANDAHLMWTLFEPLHTVVYFGPEAPAAFAEAGLRGFWRGYFAGRAAPLGPVGAAPVVASFFSFAPPMAERALPAVWDLITPADALRVRRDGAVAALRAVLGADLPAAGELADLAGELEAAVDCLDPAGRVLGAANAALPRSDEPLARLWQAATTLREHRGDGHIAALVAAGVDGCEALVWRTARDGGAGEREYRGWAEEQWAAAGARLADRGWLAGDGSLTEAGREERRGVEAATDRAAAAPWRELGQRRTALLAERLTPLARAAGTLIPPIHPIGVPRV
ncbi:MAG TPA: hypothetical protein VFX70_18510 [Mycobacteriales bacterium]|nr:hypothetical protein [Mycobacteriales bacterium]